MQVHNNDYLTFNHHSSMGHAILSVTLFAASALFGAIHEVDAVLGILTKLVSLSAGLGSLYMFVTSLKNTKQSNEKSDG